MKHARTPSRALRPALAALALVGCGELAPPAAAADTGRRCVSDATVIKLGKLIDPVDGGVLEDALVVVRGDRIVSVGVDPRDVPCGAASIDWSAYTGLPGLVDVHTHRIYQTDDEPGTSPWARSGWLHQHRPAALAALARTAAARTLALGVTTVIDKGSGSAAPMVAALRDAIAAGEAVGPRIYSAGPGIGGPVESSDALRARVREQAAGGSDLIKIWADRCSDTHLVCEPLFTGEQLMAGVDEAHRLGKSVAVHAYHADTAALAILAGPDTLEHPEGMDAVDLMDMDAMGITYVPTIDHNRYYRDNLGYFGYEPGMLAEFDAYIADNLATTARAHLAGVKIALGSDAVFTGFGENKGELGWFIEAGMTPLEALRAATIRGAETIAVDHEVGRVAPGYFADIIAVDGDPLADIDAVLHRVRGVIKGGVLLPP